MLRIWSVMERNRTDEDVIAEVGRTRRTVGDDLSAAEGWIPRDPSPSALLKVKVTAATNEGKKRDSGFNRVAWQWIASKA